jgi:maltose O-acetyltransferase
MTTLEKLRQDPGAYFFRALHQAREGVCCAVSTVVTRCAAAMRGVQVAGGLRCWGIPTFRREAGATIRVGRNCALRTAPHANNIGLYTPTRITANTRGAVVAIGEGVGMSADLPGRTAPVHIGRDVFIGARTVVLKGSRIGDGTVIGAGSVVSGDIPAGVIAAGNPCRVVRRL